MRRVPLTLTCLAAAVLAGGCTRHASGSPVPHPHADRPVSTSAAHLTFPYARHPLTANLGWASRDSASMLASVRLPPGARRVEHEPTGDSGYLRAGGQPTATSTAVSSRHAWWVLPGSDASVTAYISAHRPAHSTENMHGSGGNLRTGASSLSLGFSWRPVRNRLNYRELTVITATLPDGRTGVLAQAQSSWVVLRSPQERVPAGVSAVEVTFKRAARRIGARRAGPTSRVTITSARAVRRAVSLVGALDVMQPGALSCTLEAGPTGSLNVGYSAGPAGPALAQAHVTLYAGWGLHGGDTACDPTSFSVRGHTEPALVGAAFIRQIVALAGLRAG